MYILPEVYRLPHDDDQTFANRFIIMTILEIKLMLLLAFDRTGLSYIVDALLK